MQNTLNNTQATPNTDNPQDVGGADNANNGADFQQTAPVDVLTKSQTLEVQQTGDPISGGLPAATDSSWSFVWWGLGILVIVVVASILAIRFLKQQDEEAADVAPATVKEPAASKAAAQPAAKKPVKKTKSGKPAIRKRKKSAKKRR